MRFCIKEVMDNLKKERPIFHNERDFQFALAWKIKEIYPDYLIRLEYCFPEMQDNKRSYVDLVVSNGNDCILFELKYKTIQTSWNDPNTQETFHLQNHGARDFGCYYVLQDLSRIEKELGKQRVNGWRVDRVYSILMTNDEKYKSGFRKDSLFENYGFNRERFQKGVKIKFNISPGKAKDEYCIKKLDEITLEHDYDVNWITYSEIEDCKLSMVIFACPAE